MPRIPTRLKADPIVEAVAELRFTGTQDEGMASLLAGALAGHFRSSLPSFQKLPSAHIPAEFLRTQPDLRYVPQVKLSGPQGAVMIGDHSLAVAIGQPYRGWESFSALIEPIWRFAGETGFVGDVERLSVKYVNLLPEDLGGDHLAMTRVVLQIGEGEPLSRESLSIRMELPKDDGIVAVVQLVSQAIVQRGDGHPPVTGLVIDVDTIKNGPFTSFWTSFMDDLRNVHRVEKEQFFAILTDAAIASREPEY